MATIDYLNKAGLTRIMSWLKYQFHAMSGRLDSTLNNLSILDGRVTAIENNSVIDNCPVVENMLAPACEELTASELKKVYTYPIGGNNGGEYIQMAGQANGFYAHYDGTSDTEYPMVSVTNHGTQFWVPIEKGQTYTLLFGEMWTDGDTQHRQYNTVGEQYSVVIGLSGNEQARLVITPCKEATHRVTFTATASGNARIYFIWHAPKMKCLTVLMMQMYKGKVTQMNQGWYKWYQLDKLLTASQTSTASAVVEEPAVDTSVVEEPAVDTSVVEEPATDTSVVEEPATE